MKCILILLLFHQIHAAAAYRWREEWPEEQDARWRRPRPYLARPYRDQLEGSRYSVVVDYDPQMMSTSAHPERELSVKKGQIVTVHGMVDQDGFVNVDIGGRKGLLPINVLDRVTGMTMGGNNIYPEQSSGNQYQGRLFTVKIDYDPATMSSSRNPGAELALHRGDIVTAFGNVDENGYYLAEHNGRRGLVPSYILA